MKACSKAINKYTKEDSCVISNIYAVDYNDRRRQVTVDKQLDNVHYNLVINVSSKENKEVLLCHGVKVDDMIMKRMSHWEHTRMSRAT